MGEIWKVSKSIDNEVISNYFVSKKSAIDTIDREMSFARDICLIKGGKVSIFRNWETSAFGAEFTFPEGNRVIKKLVIWSYPRLANPVEFMEYYENNRGKIKK